MDLLSQNAAATYAELIRPSFAPPSAAFGIAWGILYPIIFITFGIVFWLGVKKKVPRAVVLPFFLNLVFNFAFSPIAFGLQNNFLASLDVFLILATLTWAMFAIWKYSKTLALAQIPYFLWVSFATILQLTITVLNA